MLAPLLWQRMAVGAVSFSFALGATPLAAQGIPSAEPSEARDETLSFCQTLQEQVSPWDSSPDLTVLSDAIASDENIDRLCNWLGEQVLPLNILLASDAAAAQQLIERGADVNARDGKGDTPLHYVGASVAEQLLAAGARLDVQDNRGRAPLHQAVLEEQVFFGPELVELFLNVGADASTKDNNGETALDIARRLDKSHIAARFPGGEPTASVETPDNTSPPSVELANAQIETIRQEAQSLLQSARQESLSDEVALEQLNRAAELAQQLSEGRDRNPLLYAIGLELIDHGQLDEARAIAQLMTYDRETDFNQGRPQMEEALVAAYVRAGEVEPVRSLITSARVDLQDSYWAEAIEGLVARGDLPLATGLIGQISTESYALEGAIGEINRAYIGLEQFDQAAHFIEQQSFRDVASKARAIKTISVWAGRSGQLETASTAIDQLPPISRAEALVDLIDLARYRGQRDLAMTLLSEAAQLPYDGSSQQDRFNASDQSDWQVRFDINHKIASRYVELGQMETAKQLMIAAERANPAPEGGAYPTEQWVGAFAQFGSVDRAMQLIDNLPATQRQASQFSLAEAYVEASDYDRAITVLSQIPQRISFSRPKQQLYYRILEETLAAEQYSLAKRAAKTIQNPGDRVSPWLKIASAYQENQQTSEATDALDRAFALVSSVERQNGWLDVDLKSKTSKGELLLKIAKGYWAAGQREPATATAKAAVEATKSQPGDGFSYAESSTLRAIAQAGRDWQVPVVQETAARQLEAQSGSLSADDPATGFEQLRRLIIVIESAYNPDLPPSDVFNRNLSRLEDEVEQDVASGRSPATLHELVALYSQIDRPEAASTVIEALLAWVESQPVENRDGHYSRLASSLLRMPELEAQFQILSRLSTTKAQIDVLAWMVPYLAEQEALSIEYFDRLMALAEASLSSDDKDRVTINLARSLSSYETGKSYDLPPRTSDQVALMMRLPQHVDDPLLRASMWISFMPNLPSAQKAQAYEALSATLKETPSDYARREMLWAYIREALSHGAFEEATQIAYALEGEYCRTALGWIETVREQQEADG